MNEEVLEAQTLPGLRISGTSSYEHHRSCGPNTYGGFACVRVDLGLNRIPTAS